jgi:hypothetical protein
MEEEIIIIDKNNMGIQIPRNENLTTTSVQILRDKHSLEIENISKLLYDEVYSSLILVFIIF